MTERTNDVKAIGVSNFQMERLMDLMIHNEVVPAELKRIRSASKSTVAN